MNDRTLKQLEKISQAIVDSSDLVQGGGNTYVKLSDTLMAVKASGYQIKTDYANSSISLHGKPNKLKVNVESGEITYRGRDTMKRWELREYYSGLCT